MKNLNVAEAVVRTRKWPYALIWILPIIVAVVAGLYLRDYLFRRGPTIVIKFSDASGLVEGQTKLLYRGAEVGRVTSIILSEDRKHSLVSARLQKQADIFATKGAVYWIVRPEISETGFSGMDTVMTGSYIHASPGKGDEDVVEFDGLAKEPLPYEEGERFVLTTPKLGHIQKASAVSYKGIPVGRVEEIELAKDASHVDIRILVWTRYGHLVRENTKFWIDNGFDFKGGIFSGFQMSLGSLQTLASGGIAFATPDKESKGLAKNGSYFAIEEDPKREWERWSPKASVSPKNTDAAEQKTEIPAPASKSK